jgi:hypothetical protein
MGRSEGALIIGRTGPKRFGRQSERTWLSAANKSQEAGQLTALAKGTEGLRATWGTDPALTRMAHLVRGH